MSKQGPTGAVPSPENQFIAAVLDTIGALVVVLDRQGRVVRFNAECERVTGFAAAEMLGQPYWVKLLPEAERPRVRAVFDQLAAGNFPNRCDNLWCTKTGAQRLIAWSNTALLDTHGEVEYVIGTGIDITERKQAEAELRESEAKLREITSELGDGIYVLDRAGNLTFMNRAAERMLGWREEELLGKNAHEAFHFQKPDGTYVPLSDCPVYQSIHSGETYRIPEDWFTRRDGMLFPVSFVASPLHRGGEIIGSVAAFQDISERRQAEVRIHFMAHHDMLTGLPNRSLLADRLEQTLARAKRQKLPFVVMFLDLDHFKMINDTLGHDVGDALLIVVADRLRECVRESDTVARMGGDEFVILLSEVSDAADAQIVAAKTIAVLNQPVRLAGQERQIGVSVGIALYPAHGESAQALMKHADIAMYQAKEGGRNAFRIYDVDAQQGEHLEASAGE